MWARAGFIRKRSPVCRRCYSFSIPDYHPKVRAIPFAFPPEVAITHVGPVAASVTRSFSPQTIREELGCLCSSFIAKHIPALGYNSIQPERTQALYYPSWCVDAEAEAKVWFSSDPDVPPEVVTVHFQHAELPGNGTELARVSLRDETIAYRDTEPFVPALANQHGSEILCLPFNINPLELLSRARDISFGATKVDDDFRFDPRSIKFNLVAAYPVLIPVYVLQYAPQGPYSRVTIIVEAYADPGRYYVHFVNSPDLKKLPAQDFFDEEDFIAMGVSGSKCRFSPCIISPRSRPSASEDLCAWMSNFFENRDAPLRLTSKQSIDMDDCRVREWTEEEVSPVHEWMQLGKDLVRIRGMIKTISTVNVDQIKVFEFPPRMNTDPKKVAAGLQGFFKAEGERLRKLEETRAARTPAWWRQWQDSQKPT
ncbi:hypothetical protein BKA82DRAFT_991330 [Pisolithus tinctorius]|uniref:Uncharacterized protein n=1 Tax=Pisolithus tinctorius Marx 270 TaxID=870435 RepID=A0A0C3PK42_PISTI|nr:hypothetical protein BKA82DRAFT_991330 [Pisolithus tinctorius]KIO14570.1 hypothetical protein M404DRAFT_991330 [Pisolithus tinctorius Marx 270]